MRIDGTPVEITKRVMYQLQIPRWPVDWSEDDLLAATIKLGSDWRWACCHFRPARTRKGFRTTIQGHVGFPDLALARDGVVLLRELKGPKGRVSSEQYDWAQQIQPGWREDPDRDLGERKQLWFDVWRPTDWQRLIIPTLTATRARRAA